MTNRSTAMNLLFDLDGTLTNPQLGIVGCIRHALEKLEKDPDAYGKLERFIGPPLLHTFQELLGNETDAHTAVKFYRERFSTVGLFENEVYDGIANSLSEFSKRGCRMWVATSKPKIYADKIIEHFQLAHYFEHVYGSELDGQRSDKSELIKYLLAQEKIDAANTTMIGDRSYDIVGAKANNVRAAGVLWGFGSQEELTIAGAEIICGSPSELVASLSN